MVLLLSGLPHDHPDESAGSICGNRCGMVAAYIDHVCSATRTVAKDCPGPLISLRSRPYVQLTLIRRGPAGPDRKYRTIQLYFPSYIHHQGQVPQHHGNSRGDRSSFDSVLRD